MQNHDIAFPKSFQLGIDTNGWMKGSLSSVCAHLFLVAGPRLFQVSAVASVMYHIHSPSEQPVWFSLLK